MPPVPAPSQILYDAIRCAALGCIVGAARSLLPAKGRAAFAPDMLETGLLLLLLQSYAAGPSEAGALRGYMLAGGFVAALAAQAALTVPLRFLCRLAAAPARFAVQKVLLPPLERRRERVMRAKVMREEKISAKKRKKTLQKPGRMMYNSNV